MTVITTPEHPFYTDEGWISAGFLTVGDEILSLDGTYGDVESITISNDPQMMYNLTVDISHTFAVGEGQWVVHNQCPLYRGTTNESQIKAYLETNWVLSDVAIDAYNLALAGMSSVDDALKVSEIHQKNIAKGIAEYANLHSGGLGRPRTFISFSTDYDVSKRFGNGINILTIDSVDLDSSNFYKVPSGGEFEVLVPNGIKWDSFLRLPK